MDPELANKISYGLLWGLAFIFSTTAHEAAHALVAKWGGDPTAYEGGQVTLNPMPHIKREPFGMVVVPIIVYAFSGFMFGWASAPYDPYWAQRHPKRAAWMALAGPVANLLIVLVAAGIFRLLITLNLFPSDPMLYETVGQLFLIMIVLNLLLFIFNLIPLAPLDGAHAAVLLFPTRMAEQVLEKTHALGAFGIFIAWLVMNRLFEVINLSYMAAAFMGIR